MLMKLQESFLPYDLAMNSRICWTPFNGTGLVLPMVEAIASVDQKQKTPQGEHNNNDRSFSGRNPIGEAGWRMAATFGVLRYPRSASVEIASYFSFHWSARYCSQDENHSHLGQTRVMIACYLSRMLRGLTTS